MGRRAIYLTESERREGRLKWRRSRPNLTAYLGKAFGAWTNAKVLTGAQSDAALAFILLDRGLMVVKAEKQENACLAHFSCLDELARLTVPSVCMVDGCNQPYTLSRQRIGTAAKYSWTCSAGHLYTEWLSQSTAQCEDGRIADSLTGNGLLPQSIQSQSAPPFVNVKMESDEQFDGTRGSDVNLMPTDEMHAQSDRDFTGNDKDEQNDTVVEGTSSLNKEEEDDDGYDNVPCNEQGEAMTSDNTAHEDKQYAADASPIADSDDYNSEEEMSREKSGRPKRVRKDSDFEYEISSAEQNTSDSECDLPLLRSEQKSAIIDELEDEKEIDKFYECYRCENFQTHSDKVMRYHLRKVHGVTMTCEDCGLKFHNQKELFDHARSTSCAVTRSQCERCGVVFNKRFPRLHNCARMIRRSEPRVLTCAWPDCRRSFKNEYARRVHERIHTDSRPYTCTLCDYSGRQRTALNWHMKSSHGLVAERHPPAMSEYAVKRRARKARAAAAAAAGAAAAGAEAPSAAETATVTDVAQSAEQNSSMESSDKAELDSANEQLSAVSDNVPRPDEEIVLDKNTAATTSND